MSFYGEINNIYKTNWTYDRIYPNKDAMDKNCASDGVLIGRFVLIEYDTGEGYTHNDGADGDNNYDSTVWQKVKDGNEIKYKKIADLNAQNPKIQVNILNPDENPEIKQEGNSNNYTISLPKAWQFAEDANIDFGLGTTGFEELLNPANIITNITDEYEVKLILTKENDNITKKFSFDFPILGKFISNTYDIIYGKERLSIPSYDDEDKKKGILGILNESIEEANDAAASANNAVTQVNSVLKWSDGTDYTEKNKYYVLGGYKNDKDEVNFKSLEFITQKYDELNIIDTAQIKFDQKEIHYGNQVEEINTTVKSYTYSNNKPSFFIFGANAEENSSYLNIGINNTNNIFFTQVENSTDHNNLFNYQSKRLSTFMPQITMDGRIIGLTHATTYLPFLTTFTQDENNDKDQFIGFYNSIGGNSLENNDTGNITLSLARGGSIKVPRLFHENTPNEETENNKDYSQWRYCFEYADEFTYEFEAITANDIESPAVEDLINNSTTITRGTILHELRKLHDRIATLENALNNKTLLAINL